MPLIHKIILITLCIVMSACICVAFIRNHVSHSSKHIICCVAGKSGGHIIPCLTLAQQETINQPHANILFFSSSYPLDSALLADNAAVSLHVPLAITSVQSGLLAYPTRLWQLLIAFMTSIRLLYQYPPTTIITTGGIVAVPVCIAGSMLGIPIELYNLDAIPGKAARCLAPLAQTVHVCFAQTQRSFSGKNCVISSYPVRFSPHEKSLSRTHACAHLGLNPSKKNLLIIGGSQGSVQINNAIKHMLETGTLTDLQIIHQTGSTDDTDWQKWYASQGIDAYAFAYKHSLAPCYAAADLIISRAGAGSLFEIDFFEKPCIIIPLEADTTDHQVDNAYAFQAQYAHPCTVVRHAELEANHALLASLIQKFLTR